VKGRERSRANSRQVRETKILQSNKLFDNRQCHPIRCERGAVGYHICLTCDRGLTHSSSQCTEDPRFEPGRSYIYFLLFFFPQAAYCILSVCSFVWAKRLRLLTALTAGISFSPLANIPTQLSTNTC
jgi:hypothetical protein